MNAASILFDPNIPLELIAEALTRAGIVVEPTSQSDVFVARRESPDASNQYKSALLRRQAD
jgi:hypothetical protein